MMTTDWRADDGDSDTWPSWVCDQCGAEPQDGTLYVAYTDGVKREMCGECHDRWELLSGGYTSVPSH